jgi:poly(3-hydroxybutyrate) depolymerase
MKRILWSLSLVILIIPAKHAYAGNAIIIDSKHYSNVFGEIRNFRIFLPPGYYDNPEKRYPVIYFHHGWSQRYFGSINATGYDEGESNNGDNIANFVATHDVIVVKPDGYNRKPQEEYYLRPYNISPVETYRQFPLYFPELVKYIDANYKTIPDRNHRAIAGLSMGGFMTFWISGKYPHLVSAAGNFCGSTEFVVGPENSPVEYRHIDMAKNYAGVNVRLNYGNKDFIRCYHRDMNRVWQQVMDNYEYKIYDAEHTTCGLIEMFEFIMNTFNNPPAVPKKWDHIDVYPEFGVWDYLVSSDRDISGFTVLENVDKRGFRCSVMEFLPDGELMPFIKLSVTTAPVYEKNQEYIINDIDKRNWKATRKTVKSDSSGRLKIELNGSVHEIGINKSDDSPLLCISSVQITDASWAVTNKKVAVNISLLNKGMSNAENVKAILIPARDNTKVLGKESDFGTVEMNSIRNCSIPFRFLVSLDSIEIVKFKLVIHDGKNHEWTDFFEIPIRKELPLFKNVEIADGRTFTVPAAGVDSVSIFLGTGNGDGIANPGESIVLLVKDQGRYWRTELYTSDKFVNKNGINARYSDNWGNYDHVGGSAKYSVPLLSSDCPQNHNIEFFAGYWLPDYPDHIIKQGKINIIVTGEDHTPPVIRWANVSGDNTVQVKAYDGSKIKQVIVRLKDKDDPQRTIEAVLNDDGKDGDRTEADGLFTKKIPEQKFGLFRMEIEVKDSFGNNKFEICNGLFVFH